MEEARIARKRVYEARYYVQGPMHTDTLMSLEKLALVLAKRGELVEAEQQARKAFQLRAEKLGASHIDTLRSARILAGYLRDLGSEQQQAEAQALLQEAKKDMQQLLGLDHNETIASQELLGKVLASLGELDQAVRELEQVVELLSKTAGPKNSQTLEVIQTLASLKESAALQGRGSVKRLDDS
ncbi:unnamed protein product, partial [Symbiodinium pilosum]